MADLMTLPAVEEAQGRRRRMLRTAAKVVAVVIIIVTGLRRAALVQGQIVDSIDADTRLLGDAMARSRDAAGAGLLDQLFENCGRHDDIEGGAVRRDCVPLETGEGAGTPQGVAQFLVTVAVKLRPNAESTFVGADPWAKIDALGSEEALLELAIVPQGVLYRDAPCLIHGKRVRMSAARSLTTASADIPGEYVSAQAAVLELGIRKAGEIVVGVLRDSSCLRLALPKRSSS